MEPHHRERVPPAVAPSPSPPRDGRIRRAEGRRVFVVQELWRCYYGGHGYMFSESKLGYWIPADANTITAASWLSNRDITQFIARIRAHQILMITDSCYSGSIIAGHQIHSAAKGLDDLTIRKRRTVVVLTSGGEEPVADQGVEGHSIFAWNLMQSLKTVDQWAPGARVFDSVRDNVTKKFPQTPQYGESLAAGHQEGGDYLFEVRQY